MANFCSSCGSPLKEGAKFCENCGAPQAAAVAPPPASQTFQYTYPVFCGNGPVRSGIPAPGFSDRVNHPEILAAVQKSRKGAKIFALFLVPLPLIGFLLYSRFSDEMETGTALLIGAVVSVIFLLFALFGFRRERAENTYEATVTDQKQREKLRNHSNDDYIIEYITYARTPDGTKKTIREYGNGRVWAYHYLRPGDRFRYHPQFAFPYELYDKSHADGLYCVSCQTKNPVEADRCSRCNLPLLK